MTTSVISGTKMSSFITCLLFFVSVGLVSIQGFQFPSDDGYGSFSPFGESSARASANTNGYGESRADANARTQNGFGQSTGNANAKSQGDNNYANSFAETNSNNYGGSSRAGSNSGTYGGYGSSGSDARAETFVDQFGNAHAKSESHAQSGYGGSNAASASATTGINQFGQPVSATATGTASAGLNGQSNAMSGATVIGGNNYPRNNYEQSNLPYPYNNRGIHFGFRSGVDDDDDKDSKAESEAR